MATIRPRRGTTTPGTGTILQNELAVDTTNKRIFIGAANGSGTLIGSAPAGSDTQIQFNDGGFLGGDAGLTFNKTTDDLTIGGDLNVNGGDIVTNQTTASIFNATAVTINAFGAANVINFGKLSSTLNLQNTIINLGNSSGGQGISFQSQNNTLNGESPITITAGGTLTLTTVSSVIPTCAFTTQPKIVLTAKQAEEVGSYVEITGQLRLAPVTAQGKIGCSTLANSIAWINSNTITTTTLTNAATTTISIAFPTSTGTLLHTAGGWIVTSNVTFNGDIALNGGDLTTTSATSTLFNATTTNLSIGGDATTLAIGNTATAAQTVNMFTASTGASTYNFATGATSSATTKTLNLGTGGAASSTTNINIGSTNGGTLTLSSPTISIGGNIIDSPTLRKYNEPTSSPTITTNTLTLDLSVAQVFTVALNASVTTLTISNTPSTASRSIAFTLILTADGTARTITWPGSVKWASATPPTLTSTNGKIDVFTFVTTNAGTNWLAFVGGQNF